MGDAAERVLSLPGLPGGGLVPWLASLWRDLRSRVLARSATKEEAELLHLLEYAASRHGDVLLAARDVDDLDDRLDAQLDDPDVFRWNALISSLALPSLRNEVAESGSFVRAAEPVLGAGQARALEAAEPLLDAWLRAQQAALLLFSDDDMVAGVAAIQAIGPAILTRPDVPPEVAAAFRGALTAGLCTLAVARAINESAKLDGWLARALVERLIDGVRAHLRLIASVPGVNVSEAVMPHGERLDPARIEERHRRARELADRAFAAARKRSARGA